MQFCQKHWDELRAAIDGRGLAKFVSEGGEEVARRMSDPKHERDFDPLMDAHMAIVQNLAATFGVGVLMIDGCPLCGAIDNCPCADEVCAYATWIGRAADDQRERAVALGMIGGA